MVVPVVILVDAGVVVPVEVVLVVVVPGVAVVPGFAVVPDARVGAGFPVVPGSLEFSEIPGSFF